MAEVKRHTPRRRNIGVWDKFVGLTIGNAITFIVWCCAAIFISIVIEWIGMIFWWSPMHSREMLHAELSFLNSFGKNLITGVYPAELAITFIRVAQENIQAMQLDAGANKLKSSANAILVILGYAAESAINTIFIFFCRLAVCVSAASGFVLIALVALIDGLTERDIRKACGGNESAMRYHHAKRFIFPSVALAFGFYLTVPFTVHPALVFLPIMMVTGFTIYVASSTFKKYL
jgi:integrating conjugative element membrane protein (TIGR03747 family)